ncbi:cyclic AMP-dependent transcription factor ATF-1-like isoform X1 [Planococcus citri]|uniref:cyclic AMP-dependent transcription factor ATF-1-like isoform X1 n=2 Tax=Planococcus citri TaxID=170843 RepID=UPI0031F8B831
MRFTTKDMDGMVEENGSHEGGPLDSTNGPKAIAVTTCVQSVIQPNQQSVIQSATGNIQPTVLTKGNVILVSKPNSVIQTAQGSLQTLQVVVEAHGSDDDDSLSPRSNLDKKRRDILSHSPSRRKLENNLGAGEIFPKLESSGSDCDSNLDSELSSHSISVSSHYQSVLPNETLHMPSQSGEDVQGLPTITMTTAGTTAGGTILHYAGQDGQFFVPGEIVVMQNPNNETTNSGVPEDQAKKREIRLLKNREAARECRRKKKEYIKCLENRVAVLEAQNKALIDELKSLKELYCSQKTE